MRMRTIGLAALLAAAVGGTAQAQTGSPPPAPGGERTALKLLLDKGIITQAEYDAAVASQAQAAATPPPVTSKWAASLYGFIEADSIYDSTQSFADLAGNGPIARGDSWAGLHHRLTFGERNSRIGFRFTSPESNGIRVSGLFEMDFLGNQPASPPAIGEGAFFTSPTFRIRHAALKLEDDVVDVLAGQYWELFGWQSYFHPATVEIQGVPGQVYSRAPQLRLSHLFKASAVSVDVAVAASRPPQRDAYVPDGQAGLRLLVNDWKGVHSMGATGTSTDPAGFGVSGVWRRFELPQYVAKPTASDVATGWGFSADALIPVIPASPGSRGNALTLNGSFQRGDGIADLYTGLTGGIAAPALPGTTASLMDAGLVGYDTAGNLRAIGWRVFLVGIQYYLPGSGNVWVAANYSQMNSINDSLLVGAQKSKVFTQSRWADANVFWDVTPAVRFGLEYAWFNQTYADGADATNHRVQFSAFYIF